MSKFPAIICLGRQLEIRKNELKKGTRFIPQVVFAAARTDETTLLRNTEKYSALFALSPARGQTGQPYKGRVLESNQASLSV